MMSEREASVQDVRSSNAFFYLLNVHRLLASRVACPPHPENQNATLLYIKYLVPKRNKHPSICDMPCKHHPSISLVSSAPLPFRHPIYSSDKSCNTLISALPGLSIQLKGIARYRWLFGPWNAEQWGNGATHCVFLSIDIYTSQRGTCDASFLVQHLMLSLSTFFVSSCLTAIPSLYARAKQMSPCQQYKL